MPEPAFEMFFPVFLSAALFCAGMTGVLLRRNILVILMSLELMLNAVSLNFVAFSRIYGYEDGPLIVIFIISLAAAEAGVGLALAVRVYRIFKTLSADSLNRLRDKT